MLRLKWSARSIALIYIFAIGIVLITIGCVLRFGVRPGIIDDHLAENAKLYRYTGAFYRWMYTPMQMEFKVYIFNVKNPKQVEAGEKPIVEEIGPYVYGLNRQKVDVSFIDDKYAYQYLQNTYYQFNYWKSSPLTPEDEVTVLNVAQQDVLQKSEDMTNDEQMEINMNLNSIFADTKDTLFHTITVRELLFDGYKFCDHVSLDAGIVCNKIKEQSKNVETITVEVDQVDQNQYALMFAFFKHKQNKNDGPYIVKSGISDVNEVGEIIRWNNKIDMDFWSNENDNICNKIRGRDFYIYPPFNDKDTVHEVFTTDTCRISSLTYAGKDTYNNVDGHVSTLGVESLLNRHTGACYCVKGVRNLEGAKECFPDGFGDISTCTGTTVVMSFPHFLYADQSYANTTNGLRPAVNMHRTYVTVEPQTGTPLIGAKRMQYNMIIRPISAYPRTSNLNPAVLPLLWVEEEFSTRNYLIDLLINQYFDKLFTMDAITYTLIGLGALLAVTSAAGFLMRNKINVLKSI